MAKFLNNFFICLACFFLCFCWLTFYKQELWIRYVLSVLFAIILFCILYTLSKKSNALPTKKKGRLNEYKYALAFLNDYDIFVNIFKSHGYLCKALNKGVWCVEKKEKTLLVFLFRLNNVVAQDLINAYKQANEVGANKIIIFGITLDPTLWRWQSNLDVKVTLLNCEGVLDFLKRNGKRIAPYQLKRKNRFFDKNLFYYAFNKSRSKHYFTICIILLVSSFISFFPIYDIVVASICFGLGIYSIFNKRFNPQFELLAI